jgi:hypothetical protein
MAVFHKYPKWFLALFLVLMGTDACRSDVKIISASDKGVIARIELTGQITKAEIGKFEKVVALLRPIFDNRSGRFRFSWRRRACGDANGRDYSHKLAAHGCF